MKSEVSERFRSLKPSAKARLILAVVGGVLLTWLLVWDKPWTINVPHSGAWKLSQHVAVYVWVAVLINLIAVIFLGLTCPWWTRPLLGSPLSSFSSPPPTPRWFWPLVAVAMALNAWICWPRLWQSFWHDENYPLRNAIVGAYRMQPDGSLKLKPVPWQATFFHYKKPNHTLYSGVARVCNDAWRWIVRPAGLQFSEPVIRFPAYLAGIASIATIALLLNELGFVSAGVDAAFLSAIHPWHIRYASEARAYAFVLCLIPLVILFLVRAVGNGRWRWWSAFGIAAFLLMYSYPTCFYVMIVLNVCAVPAILWRWGKGADAMTQLLRLSVTNLVAAMLFLPLMLPCVPQFLAYVKGTPGQGTLGFGWLQNLLAHLLSGIPWGYRGHSEPGCLELSSWFFDRPAIHLVVMFLATGFLVAGICRLVAKDRTCALVAIVLLLPAIICFAETKARGLFINEWYLIFVLPGVLALAALGIDYSSALVRAKAGRVAGTACAVLVITGYAAWSAPQRHFLMTRSIQPNRESVLLTRPSLDPHDPKQQQILTATFYGPPDPYDPNIMVVHNAIDLGNLVRRADAEGKPLFINLGYLTTVEGSIRTSMVCCKIRGFSKISEYSQASNPPCKAGMSSVTNQAAQRSSISARFHATGTAPAPAIPTDRISPAL